jgi:hypothetical protein
MGLSFLPPERRLSLQILQEFISTLEETLYAAMGQKLAHHALANAATVTVSRHSCWVYRHSLLQNKARRNTSLPLV